jgi:hypothetical protein
MLRYLNRHLPVLLLGVTLLLLATLAAVAQDRAVSYTSGSTNLRSLAADANTEVTELYNRAKAKCTAAGTNTITCTSISAPATALADGMTVSFIAAASSTGAVTFNLDGRGAVSVFNAAGSAIGSGDLVSGTLYVVEYRATGPQWRIISAGASGGGGGAAVGADYLQLSGNGTNTNERIFTAGTGLTGTDAGANSTYTLAISDAELLAIAGLTSAADRLPYFTGLGTGALATFTAAGRAIVDDADATAQRATLGLTIGTNVQAQDGELQAIAGLTSAADTAPYFTGSGTAALLNLTAAGRAILDDADATAQRVTLGLAIGTNVQAFDADLSALAGVTSAVDALPYFTGSGTATVTTLTSAGRALIDDADAATQRTTLGLTIGTNVQAFDAELSALAGLTSAADAMPYFTGVGTATTTTVTTAGRAILDDADATAQRTTLGLGTLSTQNANAVNISGGTISGITDLGLADGGTGATLADPNADRLMWWDDSASAVEFLEVSDILTEAAPAAGDFLLAYEAGGGFVKVNWSSLPGGGLSDGDKGDIIVGGSGTTLTIDQATAVTAFGSGDTFPCFEGSVIKQCSYADLPGAGGGIANVVEDATPQLGGQLDVNTFALGDGTRELLTFVEDAAAVNHIEIENNAAGTAAILRATGDDTNVGLTLEAKGSGALTFEGSTIWTAANDGSGSGLDADTIRATTPTTAGLAILDDADATAQRTTLGLAIGTNVQAFDADLSALAGVTSAANALPYFTGSGTATTTTLTATGRALIDDATVADQRTTLGLAIGTDVQGFDADLSALGGVTSAADALPYFTGIGTATTTTMTAAGRALLDDADATAQRTTLGLAIGTNVQAFDADLSTIGGLADPNADRFLFWDDSAGAYAYLAPGTGFSINGTTLTVSGVETIWIPANSMMPNTTAGCATATTETTTNDVMVPVCDFDAAADEAGQFLVGMPKSWDEGTITAQFSWTAATGTGNVVWGMQCLARSDDDVLDTAFGTAVTVTDGLTATGDLMISAASSAITVGGTPAEGDNVWCRVYRDADNGSDTFSADARLIGVKVLYTVNALTDD